MGFKVRVEVQVVNPFFFALFQTPDFPPSKALDRTHLPPLPYW